MADNRLTDRTSFGGIADFQEACTVLRSVDRSKQEIPRAVSIARPNTTNLSRGRKRHKFCRDKNR